MTLTCLWQPWGQFRRHQVPQEYIWAISKEKAQIATDEQRWIRIDQIWSRVAKGWLWQASGNPGGSLGGIKSPKSISVPSLKKRHRLPKIATDEQRWVGNDQIWSRVARGWLWQASGIPGNSLEGVKAFHSTSVPCLKEKAQITTDALMLIKYSPGLLENDSDMPLATLRAV